MWTYFVSDSVSVKIGRTNTIKARLQQLQLSSPKTLELLLLLEGDHEKLLHTMFSKLRQHGEWFELTQQLQDYINKQRKDHYEHWLMTCLAHESNGPKIQPSKDDNSQWAVTIQTIINTLPTSASGRRQIVTAKIWAVLGVEKEKRDRRSSNKIARIMRSQGFQSTRIRDNGIVQVGYVQDTET